MDCLADTGANVFVLIIVGTGLLAAATGGIYLSYRSKRSFKYIASILIMMVGVLGAGILPSHSANAASSEAQCTSAVGSSNNSQGTNTSDNSNEDNSVTPAQKIWNVPFTSDSDWSNFTHYTVSEQPGFEPYSLTASGGTGTITGNRTDGGSGNHRDFFIYEPAGSSKDGEVRALIEIDGSQGGLVLRASNLGDHDHQVGVVAWTNVIFGGIGTTISGIWRGFEVPGGVVHQNVASNNSGTIKLPIASIVADGATATVTTTIPIDTNPVNTVIQIANVDPAIDGTAFVAVQDPYTFEFTTTASGTWSNIGVANLSLNNKRWIAARVIGNQLDVKHWLPGNPEPSWNDVYNSIHYTIPPTLDNGDISPTEGKFGVIAAHIGDAKTFKYSNLQFKSLDP